MTHLSKLNYLLVCCLFLNFACESVSTEDRQAAEEHFRKGLQAKDDQLYRDALTQFDSALVRNPEHFMTLLHQGLIYARMQDYAKSNASYNEAVKIKPDFLDGWYNLGNNALRQLKFNDAVEIYDKLLNLREAPEFWHNKGRAYLELGRLREAEECFDRSIDLDSTYAYGYASLGNLANRAGEYEKSASYYSKATRFAPDSDEYWFKLGVAFYRVNNRKSAEAGFRKTIEINANHTGAVLNLAQLLRESNPADAQRLFKRSEELRKQDSVMSRLRRAITQNPDDANIHYTLGLQFIKRKQWQEAVRAFKNVVFLNPDDPRPLINLGNIYFVEGNVAKAIEKYQAVLALNDKSTEALANVGTAYASAGNIDMARKYWQALLRIDERNVTARQGLKKLFD